MLLATQPFWGVKTFTTSWRPKVDKAGPNVAMIKLQIGHQAASYQTLGLISPPHSSYWLVPKFSRTFWCKCSSCRIRRFFPIGINAHVFKSTRFIGAMSKIPVVSYDTSQASLSPVSAISFNMFLWVFMVHLPFAQDTRLCYIPTFCRCCGWVIVGGSWPKVAMEKHSQNEAQLSRCFGQTEPIATRACIFKMYCIRE